MKAHPECPAAQASIGTFPDGERCWFRPGGRAVRPLDPWSSYPQLAAVGTPSALVVRRNALTRIGGLSVAFPGIGDYHLWLGVAAEAPLLKTDARTCGYRLHRTSMSFEDRARRGVQLLATRQRAAADALRFRLEVRPDEEAVLSRRLRLAADAVRLAAASRPPNPAAFREAARGLEESVRGEPLVVIRRFFIDLLWFFAPAIGFAEKSEAARAALAGWAKWWPEDARRTRQVLRQMLWLASLARATAPLWERVSPSWIDRVSGVVLRRIQ
jgi:hypothetical protein